MLELNYLSLVLSHPVKHFPFASLWWNKISKFVESLYLISELTVWTQAAFGSFTQFVFGSANGECQIAKEPSKLKQTFIIIVIIIIIFDLNIGCFFHLVVKK